MMTDDQNDNSAADLEQRSGVRFDIKDAHMWSFSYNNKSLPVKWFKDISTTGVRICQGKLGSLDVGELIQIQVKLLADTVLEREAIVKWKKLSDTSVNLCELGLEFDRPIEEDEFNPHAVSKAYLRAKRDRRPDLNAIQPKPFAFLKYASLAALLSFIIGLSISVFFPIF